MSSVKVISHFSAKNETERRQNFNTLAKAMIIMALGSDRKNNNSEKEQTQTK